MTTTKPAPRRGAHLYSETDEGGSDWRDYGPDSSGQWTYQPTAARRASEKKTTRTRKPDTRDRKPKPGTRHLFIRDLPESTLAALAAFGTERDQSAAACAASLLNRWAERRRGGVG